MHRSIVLGTLCVCAIFASQQALAANTWCYTNHPNAIFCEDFDRYCVDPPPEPEACAPAGEDIRNTWAMWDVWDGWHNCGWTPALHDEYPSSWPYSAKIGCQAWNNELGYGNTPLNNHIQAKFGGVYTEVLGTNQTPLTVEFGIHSDADRKIHGANLYVELGRGRGRPLIAGVDSLTNWVPGPDCTLCGALQEHAIYPRICRTSPTPPGCPDASTASIVPALAAGFVAFLDADPCHCAETNHWPRADRLAYFDGKQWWTLPAGFPDPGGSEPATGDFSISPTPGYHKIKLIITTNSVTVEMRANGVLSRCAVPRAYTGPFNSMLMGYQMPCQLAPGTWNCNGAADCNGVAGPHQTCCVSGTNGGGTIPLDDFAVYGGQGYAEPGACCFPDTSCVVEYPGNCLSLGGQPGESGSTCANTACCPPLPADHDMDTDVDLADFGWFQSCLSGPQTPPTVVPCRCADFDGDSDVDADDLTTFIGCMLGPEIAADPTCTD